MERTHPYQTKQRDTVLAYIISLNGGHVTAAQVAEHCKKTGAPVGRTTVYRQLERLTREGIIRRYNVDGISGACYQYLTNHTDCREHFHLKCESCGDLTHLNCDLLSEAQRHILEAHTFLINTTKTVFYGYCDRCRRGGK